MADLLEAEGYEVRVAANGRDGLDVLQRDTEPPCLILLDLRMPDMDGVAFLAALRAQPRLASVPVVLVSADSRLPLKTHDLGVTSIKKPVDVDELLAVVKRHCSA